MSLTNPFADTRPTVFKVDLVSPTESKTLVEPELPKPVIRKAKQPLVRHRRPPEKQLPPNTLYGKGTEEEKIKDINESASPGKEGNDSQKERDKPSALTDKENALKPDIKGPSLLPPSYLFDKKTIEKFARKGSPAKKGLTFDTSGFKHRGYMRMLKERIESIWKYPKEAERLGISGDLYMKFSIKRDGKLGEIELLRTSGYRELDEAAMKAVKDAEPFWPLPDDWDKDTLEIKGHFIYIFGTTYVM